MKEALFHIDKAINVLRRSSGPPAVISILERAHANLMHGIFGASLAADLPRSDWTLDANEPMPHYGEELLSSL